MEKRTVTIANMRPSSDPRGGCWGVWSTRTHELVGFINQNQRGGFWYIEDANGRRIEGISQCRTFDYARKCAMAYGGWA